MFVSSFKEEKLNQINLKVFCGTGFTESSFSEERVKEFLKMMDDALADIDQETNELLVSLEWNCNLYAHSISIDFVKIQSKTTIPSLTKEHANFPTAEQRVTIAP